VREQQEVEIECAMSTAAEASSVDHENFEETFLQQQDELMAMESILGSEVFKISLGEGQSGGGLTSGKILIELTLPEKTYLVLEKSTKESTYVEHLPPVTLWFTLPRGYPVKDPPLFTLSSSWLGALEVVICLEFFYQYVCETFFN